METKDIIKAKQLCTIYNIPQSFVEDLTEYQLLDFVRQDDELYLSHEHLGMFEKLIRLHYELDINYEGLDVIMNLMQRIEEMEAEIRRLRNRMF